MENQNESLIKQYVKRRAKRRLFLWLFGTSAGLITILITVFVTLFLILAAGSIDNSDSSSGGEAFTGEYRCRCSGQCHYSTSQWWWWTSVWYQF